MSAIPPLNGPAHPPASGQSPSHLILFLHGLGADGNDLLSLSDFFIEDMPDAHCIAPNAPFPCDMAPYGYQWFSLQNRAMDAMFAGVQTAEPILNQYIDQQLAALQLPPEKLIVIGFSQGTMTALHTLLRRPKPCGAIIGFSGALLGTTEIMRAEIKSKPPVCLIHGNADMVVPYEALAHSESILKACNVEVEAHTRNGLGHGIDPQGIALARAFVKKHVS